MSTRGFEQTIKWRVPCTSVKWRGKSEVVMSIVEPKGKSPAVIDIRVRKTIEHPKGEGYTREGVRLNLEDASSLAKAIQHALSELRETDVTG